LKRVDVHFYVKFFFINTLVEELRMNWIYMVIVFLFSLGGLAFAWWLKAGL